MTFLRKSELSVTLGTSTVGTVGAGSGTASTFINGYIEEIYVKVDAACGANASVLITSSSTSKVLLRVTNPSSGGATFYPRKTAHETTAAGAAIGSSAIGFPIPMLNERVNERVKATIATSSAVKFRGAVATINAIWS
jgi:hypothetical protein